MKTGGGENNADELTPMEEMIFGIIGSDSIQGIASGIDSEDYKEVS